VEAQVILREGVAAFTICPEFMRLCCNFSEIFSKGFVESFPDFQNESEIIFKIHKLAILRARRYPHRINCQRDPEVSAEVWDAYCPADC
jgi:hypothetical protein